MRSFPRRNIALSILAIALGAAPLLAQRSGRSGRAGGGGTVGGAPLGFPGAAPIYGGMPPMGPVMMPPVVPEPPPLSAQVVEDEKCLPWDISAVRGAVVNVMRLEVPSKARSEYNKACSEVKKQSFEKAEPHVLAAIQKYPEYVAAWVMLGQILEGLHQYDKAGDACSHAERTDATYLPAYLCLADLDASAGHWNELLNVTQTAMGLNPVGDIYAYYYRSVAWFRLNKLTAAEKDALMAAGMDRDHHHAAVYYLLAQIYEAKGDLASATAQLRQFLKTNNDRQKSDEAKEYLAKLQAQERTAN